MKFLKSLLSEKTVAGTFVGVTMTDESEQAILDLCKKIGVKNPITIGDIHVTLVYSTTPLIGFNSIGKLSGSDTIELTPIKFEIFQKKAEGAKPVLVMLVESKELTARHNFIKKEYDATVTYPVFNPHLTLSYNAEDFDISDFDLLELLDTPIIVDTEYMTAVDNDWD